jgi:hypothetical protein
MTQAATHHYKTTEFKYKGGAQELYVTYDLWQATRGDSQALYPKVKRVYIAGHVKEWHVGTFAKRTGKKVHGVKIEYEQSRAEYTRQGYTATKTDPSLLPPDPCPGQSYCLSCSLQKHGIADNVYKAGYPREDDGDPYMIGCFNGAACVHIPGSLRSGA